MIRVVSTTDEFETLKKVWESVGNQNSLRIFQTYEWCLAAWKLYLDDGINKLRILVWTQENNPEAVIFPFYLDGLGRLRFIMEEHSDVCDCVSRIGENHHLAFKDALDFIVKDVDVKRLCLRKMDPASEVLNFFAAFLPHAKVMRDNVYSWIDVKSADDFATAQRQLRSKDKANVRAIRRKAERFTLRVLKSSHELEFPKADILRLVDEMRRSGRRSEVFMSPKLLAFCQQIYADGMADIVELLDQSGAVVALNFLLLSENRRLSWIFLYTDPHASTELYVKYLYEYSKTDDFIFDFGTGGYDYKLGTFRPCMRLVLGLDAPMNDGERRKALRVSFVRGLKDLIKSLIGRY